MWIDNQILHDTKNNKPVRFDYKFDAWDYATHYVAANDEPVWTLGVDDSTIPKTKKLLRLGLIKPYKYLADGRLWSRIKRYPKTDRYANGKC